MQVAALAVDCDGLVAFALSAERVFVLEHHEVVDDGILRPVEYDVVGLRAVEFADAQLGLVPDEAVAAFGIADDERVLFEGPAQVVHSVSVVVLEDDIIVGAVALPGRVKGHEAFALTRRVETDFRRGGVHVQQMLIEKALESVGDREHDGILLNIISFGCAHYSMACRAGQGCIRPSLRREG